MMTMVTSVMMSMMMTMMTSVVMAMITMLSAANVTPMCKARSGNAKSCQNRQPNHSYLQSSTKSNQNSLLLHNQCSCHVLGNRPMRPEFCLHGILTSSQIRAHGTAGRSYGPQGSDNPLRVLRIESLADLDTVTVNHKIDGVVEAGEKGDWHSVTQGFA